LGLLGCIWLIGLLAAQLRFIYFSSEKYIFLSISGFFEWVSPHHTLSQKLSHVPFFSVFSLRKIYRIVQVEAAGLPDKNA
jgi:hypothetical protein